MSKQLKTIFIIVLLLLVAGAFILDTHAQSLPSNISEVTSLKNGKPVTINVISHSRLYTLFSIASNFCYSLAIAIFITAFITDKLERDRQEAMSKQQAEMQETLKREVLSIQREIDENIFYSLFQRLLPEELFQVVTSELIKTPFVRRDAKWDYQFSEMEDGRIQLKRLLINSLTNITGKLQSEPIRLKFINQKESDCWLQSARISRGDEIICDFELGKLDSIAAEMSFNGHGIIVNRTDNEIEIIIPITVQPDSSVEICLTIYNIYDCPLQDEHVSQYPIINADMHFRYPQGFKFGIAKLTSAELKEIHKDETSAIYRINGAMLPMHGIVYTLRKVK